MKQKFLITVCLLAAVLVLPCHASVNRPPENGRYIQYFPGGEDVWQITWRRDERVFKRKVYHRNGRLYRYILYKDGQPIVEKVYYKSGRLSSIWTAKTGKLRRFLRDGTPERIIDTRPDGMTEESLPDSFLFH
ncbi:MAG: hypothetical protein ACLFPX_05530 [Candidatus Omnitrophota bacterium]